MNIENVKIDLTSREFPKPGKQPGVFVDVKEVEQANRRGKKFKYLVLVAQLDATKSDGRPFEATTRFNVQDARGIRSLREKLQVWRGGKTPTDLKTFDPKAEFVGKKFLAEPDVYDKEGKREIRFSDFEPYPGDSPQTSSADSVSASKADKPQ